MRITESGKQKGEWGAAVRSPGEERETMLYSLHGFGRFVYWRSNLVWLKPYIQKRPSSFDSKIEMTDVYRREFGFSIKLPTATDWSGQLFLRYGAQDGFAFDGADAWGGYKIWDFPWSNMTFRYHELLNLDLSRYKLLKRGDSSWEETPPTTVFSFKDGCDGALINAKCYAERHVWTKGCKSFAWLKYFTKPHVSTTLNLEFDREVGSRKGSWKGGTTGHSCEIPEGSTDVVAAFKAYCDEQGHEYVGHNVHRFRAKCVAETCDSVAQCASVEKA